MIAKYYTKKELSEVFKFSDGKLWRKRYVGKKRATVKYYIVKNKANCKGYCQVRFKDRMIYYHTVVYILTYGDILEDMIIDHIDGNRVNNDISNLRLVSYRENAINTENRRKNVLMGVNYHKGIGRWVARGDTDKTGRRESLGCYSTKEDAIAARRSWEAEHYE